MWRGGGAIYIPTAQCCYYTVGERSAHIRFWVVLEGAVSIYGRGLHFSAFHIMQHYYMYKCRGHTW